MADKLIQDIQTGRNVYVDSELYKSDEDYRERITSMVAEGFYPLTQTPVEALNDLSIS